MRGTTSALCSEALASEETRPRGARGRAGAPGSPPPLLRLTLPFSSPFLIVAHSGKASASRAARRFRARADRRKRPRRVLNPALLPQGVPLGAGHLRATS